MLLQRCFLMGEENDVKSHEWAKHWRFADFMNRSRREFDVKRMISL